MKTSDLLKFRRVQDQLSEARAAHAELLEALEEYKIRQKFLDRAALYSPTPRIMKKEKGSRVRECTAVALLSDVHFEETVEPETIDWLNAYSIPIATLRLKKFFEAVIWNVEHHRADGNIRIRSLVLSLLGDLITGYIHRELVESNGCSPTLATFQLMRILRDGIATLLEHGGFEKIVIPCSIGNHGRTTDKQQISTGYANSFEWLLYNLLKDMFAHEKRVHFEVTADRHQYVEVYGKTLGFHHGDSVRSLGGVGGIAVPLLRAIPRWDSVRRCHIRHVGHFHQYRDFGSLVVNGPLIGFAPYSQFIGAGYEEPSQAFYLIDSEAGKCQSTPLWVKSSKEPKIKRPPSAIAG
jgi:hypothetical protein